MYNCNLEPNSDTSPHTSKRGVNKMLTLRLLIWQIVYGTIWLLTQSMLSTLTETQQEDKRNSQQTDDDDDGD